MRFLQVFSVSALAGLCLSGASLAQSTPADAAGGIRDLGCRADVVALQQLADRAAQGPSAVQQGINGLFALEAARVEDDGAIALLPAYCGLASGASVEDVLVAGLRLNGCRLTESTAESILGPMGLDLSNTTPAVEVLVARGDATLIDDAVLMLGAPLCDGAGDDVEVDLGSDVAGAILDAARSNGCRITEDIAEATFPSMGISMSEAENVAEVMIAAGQARFNGNVLEVLAPLCVANGGSAPRPPVPSGSGALGSPDWPAFLALFEAHGCAMAYEPAALVAGDYGLDIRVADELADQLFADELAAEDDDLLVLDPSVCTPDEDSVLNTLKLDLVVEMLARDCASTLLDLTQWAASSGQDRMLAQRAISSMMREDRLVRDRLTLVLDHPNCG